MSPRPTSAPAAGFTLTETLIGMSLAMIVLTAILSSYLFLGRSLTRLSNQQRLEAESRRALATFMQDVRMASGISGTPSNSSLALVIPSGATTATVTYAYNSTTATLTRTLGTTTTLASFIQASSFAFRYFDESGQPYDNGTAPYTTVATYASGIKLVSVSFTTRTGSNADGTETPTLAVNSPRLVVRNRDFLQ